ncbi:MAG: Ig-like domain-containing protein [Leadbetterella sp.]
MATITGPTAVCVGSSIALTGSGTAATTSPWTSSSTTIATVSNTGVVTGISAGTTTITYKNSQNCTRTVSVTVNTAPTISGGTTTICNGATTTWTGSGTAASTNPWVSSNTAVATVSTTGVITGGTTTGTATITYTNNAGCSITRVITVNVPSITGPTAVCIGSTITLTGSGTAATSVPWTSSSTTIATVSNTGVVTGVSSGTTTITYKNSQNCTRTVSVTVNAAPTITGGVTTICNGATTTWTGSGMAASTNPWVSSNTTVATVSNIGVITGGTTAGTATITYTNNLGCSTTRVITIQPFALRPIGISGDVTQCQGLGVSLLATCGAGTAQWFTSKTGGTALISTTQYPVVTTKYYVGCSGEANTCTNPTRLDSVLITIIPFPARPTEITPSQIFCEGDLVNLQASCIEGIAQWFTEKIGGDSLISTNIVASETTTYYLGCSGDETTCVNTTRDDSVTITVRPLANPIEIMNGQIICPEDQVTLEATCPIGRTAHWYNRETGDPLSSTTVSPIVTTSYYVECLEEGVEFCIDQNRLKSSVQIFVPIILSGPFDVSSDAQVCLGSSVTLSASCLEGSTEWFTIREWGITKENTVEGALTTQNITVNPVTETTYYVGCFPGGEITLCPNLTILDSVKIVFLPCAARPTGITQSQILCAGDLINLEASCIKGTAQWFTEKIGGDSLLSTNIVATETTTYFVSCSVDSTTLYTNPIREDSITITVRPLAKPIEITPSQVICPGDQITLEATCNFGTPHWYNTETGDTLPSTTISPMVTSYYYVECFEVGEKICVDPSRIIVQIFVPTIVSGPYNVSPDAQVCLGSSITLSASCLEGSTEWFTIREWGITKENTVEGALATQNITVNPETEITYYVGCFPEGYIVLCPNQIQLDSVVITFKLDSLRPTGIIPMVSKCSSASLTLEGSCNNSSINWFTSKTGGEALASNIVNPTYTTTYFADCGTGLCESRIRLDSTIVYAIPTVSSNAPNSVCGDSVMLVAHGCPSDSIVWSNGQKGDSIYVKTSGSYRSVCLMNGCQSDSSDVWTVTFNPKPTLSIGITENSADHPNDGVIVIGDGFKLSANGAVIYQLNDGTSNILIGTDIYLTPSITTKYTLTGGNEFGCEDTLSTTIKVELPVGNFKFTITGKDENNSNNGISRAHFFSDFSTGTIDWGDGTITALASGDNEHNYSDTLPKTITVTDVTGSGSLSFNGSKNVSSLDVSGLPILRELNCEYNKLQGSVPNFDTNKYLEKINLGGNNLTGSVPSFTNNSRLRHLYLSSNNLTGTLPEFSSSPDLAEIYIAGNQLSGNLPNFNSNSNLYLIDLGYNNFTGQIPAFASNLNLMHVLLNNNSLSGNIPNFISNPILVSVNADANQLSGTLPSFANNPELEIVAFGNNMLTGEIPSFANNPKIMDIYMYGNQLTGSVPDFRLKRNLRTLSLENNQLFGKVKFGMENTELGYFNFQNNLFTQEDIDSTLSSFNSIPNLNSNFALYFEGNGNGYPSLGGVDYKNQALAKGALCVTNIGPLTTPILNLSGNVVLCEGEEITANNCYGQIVWNNGFRGYKLKVYSSGTYSARCDSSEVLSAASDSVIVTINLAAQIPNLIYDYSDSLNNVNNYFDSTSKTIFISGQYHQYIGLKDLNQNSQVELLDIQAHGSYVDSNYSTRIYLSPFSGEKYLRFRGINNNGCYSLDVDSIKVAYCSNVKTSLTVDNANPNSSDSITFTITCDSNLPFDQYFLYETDSTNTTVEYSSSISNTFRINATSSKVYSAKCGSSISNFNGRVCDGLKSDPLNIVVNEAIIELNSILLKE